MRKRILIASLLGCALAALALVKHVRRGDAQQVPAQLSVALYAPGVAFADAQQRAAYVSALAKAIQSKTGITTSGKAYTRLADLKAAKPDFAIIDGQCLAQQGFGTVMATASIGGSTTQAWAFFSRGDGFQALQGKKLAFMETGCRDNDFIDNAMLDSEARAKSHFGALIGKPDIAGAVATVRDYKQADAVFAPVGLGKGLDQKFATGAVPNPGFVQINTKLPVGTASQVKDAVLGYGANAGIEGWKAPYAYAGFGGQLNARVKRPVFARPDVVQIQDQDVIVPPQSKFEQTGVRQHFWLP
jgi:hypothetical protein